MTPKIDATGLLLNIPCSYFFISATVHEVFYVRARVTAFHLFQRALKKAPTD
jgi:hypothetical protein